MNFNRFWVFLAFSILFAPAYGQKLKSKKVNIKYVSLPTELLPADYNTYSVSVYGGALYYSGLNAVDFENDIKMDGFKRLNSSYDQYGHLRVYVYASYPRFGYGDLESKTTTKKDKEGKETKKTTYWYEFPASLSASYKIVDPGGELLASGTHTPDEKVKSSSSTNAAKLRKDYESIRNSLRKKFAKEALQKIVSDANKTLQTRFDFHQHNAGQDLYLVKKHKTEKQYEQFFDQAKEIFKNAEATTDPASLKEQLLPAMKFWTSEGGEDPKGDKKLLRVYKAANLNLATVNYYLDNLDDAKMYANAVMNAGGGKDGDAKRLLKNIEKTEELMALHQINTLHYQRNLTNAMAPADVAAFAQEQEELAENNNTSNGSITLNGEVIKGSMMQDKDAENFTFGATGNTKFMVAQAGQMKEYDLTAAEISSFSIDERTFKKLDFAPCAKGKSVAKKCIMEEIYATDKISLYQYFPASGALSDDKAEFAFQKATDESPISLFDTQFLLLKKGLAKYFADCPDLAGMCEEGGIGMVKDDLIKASRIYSELCE